MSHDVITIPCFSLSNWSWLFFPRLLLPPLPYDLIPEIFVLNRGTLFLFPYLFRADGLLSSLLFPLRAAPPPKAIILLRETPWKPSFPLPSTQKTTRTLYSYCLFISLCPSLSFSSGRFSSVFLPFTISHSGPLFPFSTFQGESSSFPQKPSQSFLFSRRYAI